MQESSDANNMSHARGSTKRQHPCLSITSEMREMAFNGSYKTLRMTPSEDHLSIKELVNDHEEYINGKLGELIREKHFKIQFKAVIIFIAKRMLFFN